MHHPSTPRPSWAAPRLVSLSAAGTSRNGWLQATRELGTTTTCGVILCYFPISPT